MPKFHITISVVKDVMVFSVFKKWIIKFNKFLYDTQNYERISAIEPIIQKNGNEVPFELVDVEKKPSMRKKYRFEHLKKKNIDITNLDRTYFLELSAKYDSDHPWWVKQENLLGDQLRRDKGFNRVFLEHILEWKFKTVPVWRDRNLSRLRGVPESKIVSASKNFFRVSDTASKINALKMDGIGVSVASVILTFSDPTLYCVHDTHVWRRIYGGNGKSIHTLNHYLTLLHDLRAISKKVGLPVRTIEKALFKEDFDSLECR